MSSVPDSHAPAREMAVLHEFRSEFYRTRQQVLEPVRPFVSHCLRERPAGSAKSTSNRPVKVAEQAAP